MWKVETKVVKKVSKMAVQWVVVRVRKLVGKMASEKVAKSAVYSAAR